MKTQTNTLTEAQAQDFIQAEMKRRTQPASNRGRAIKPERTHKTKPHEHTNTTRNRFN